MTSTFDNDPPEQPPSWKSSIGDYLRENDVKCEKATPMKGGASAFIWQLDGYEKCHHSPDHNAQRVEKCVMKYGDATLKSVPDVSVSPDRMSKEVKAIRSEVVAEACLQEPSVQVPEILRTTENGFIMNWAGDLDLRTAYTSDKPFDAREVGSRLGRWIGCLHVIGIDNAEAKAWTNDMLETLAGPGGIEEKCIRDAMSTDSYSQEDIDYAIAALHEPESHLTATAWDFRPMNTLVRLHKSASPELTVVDWEARRYGDPASDIRMWVAEALVLETKHGDKGLLSSFLKAYKCEVGERIVTQRFLCKVAIGVGIMLLLLTPTPIWDCTESEVETWRKIAIHYIKAGANKEMGWLEKSCLMPLTQEAD